MAHIPGAQHKESAEYFAPREGVEMMHASFRRQHFSRHFHEEYAIGYIERGAMAFRYRGEDVVAPAGSVNLVVPGEAHDGHAQDAGWTYRMFYLDPELVRRAAATLSDKQQALPHFRPGVIFDPKLAARVRRAHCLLSDTAASTLARDTALADMLTTWITRHADQSPAPHKTGREHAAVASSRLLMDQSYDQDISLDDLSRAAHLSPFHLIRVFRKAVGVSPHEYLIHTRVRRAKDLLTTPMRIADIAAETGFADQAHLTRQFKRALGVTPGRYRKFLQNSAAVSG